MRFKILSIFVFISSIAVAQTNYVSETYGNLTIEYEESLQKLMMEKANAVCETPALPPPPIKEFCDGARVQIFYSKNRSEADQKLKEAKQLFPNLYSNIVYHSPDYKVYVGYFESRNDASSTLNKAKRNFPASFIYNEKFRCNLIKN
ncbi:SPOR domain-containing protein [Moheibacter sediminis]|uniref:Sporulation related domain-containing protein n=1 Tax=Moheibacter sediminis TaxID=1434700 RepID=A0A1W2CHP9_9FLAO|nr:SPOR domain-containing protein [Moheibacter sediminis]SMC84775.1 Sporulation related domain-containing protein [Moheibacter sediminis]